MKRSFLLSTFLLAGCYEFEGELGQLGFVSSLTVRPAHQGWTPDHPIAAQMPVEVAATERIGHESEEAPQVQAALDGDLIDLDPTEGHIAFTGEAGDVGRVLFWGEASDRFSVRFHTPTGMALYEPLTSTAVEGVLHVLDGATATLAPEVHDAWGQPMGWSAGLLEAEGCGARSDESGLVHLRPRQDCTLQIALDGVPLLSRAVRVVEASDTAEVTTWTMEPVDGQIVTIEEWWTDDGARVLGVQDRHPETTSISSAP